MLRGLAPEHILRIQGIFIIMDSGRGSKRMGVRPSLEVYIFTPIFFSEFSCKQVNMFENWGIPPHMDFNFCPPFSLWKIFCLSNVLRSDLFCIHSLEIEVIRTLQVLTDLFFFSFHTSQSTFKNVLIHIFLCFPTDFIRLNTGSPRTLFHSLDVLKHSCLQKTRSWPIQAIPIRALPFNALTTTLQQVNKWQLWLGTARQARRILCQLT